VQQQYGNHRRRVKPRVVDRYSPPDLYQITRRGQLSGDNERYHIYSYTTTVSNSTTISNSTTLFRWIEI
jgi:hypothetical protein